MSRPRITGAMLRPRTTTPKPEPETARDAAATPASSHEAIASHPMFVAPQFGFRRNPHPGGGR